MYSSKFARLLASETSLHLATDKQHLGLRGWLSKVDGNFVALAEGTNTIRIETMDTVPAFTAWFNDPVRLLFAAWQSFSGSVECPADSRATAWEQIKRYYAGFFVANALSRLLHRGFTYIDDKAAVNLRRHVGMSFGGNSPLSKGFYSVESEFSKGGGAQLRLTNVSGSNSHEKVWTHLVDVLKVKSMAILNSCPNYQQDVCTEIDTLVSALCGVNGPLSRIRNEVNYQLAHEVWFPFDNKLPKGKISQTWRLPIETNSMRKLDTLAAFNSVLGMLCGIGFDYIEEIDRLAPSSMAKLTSRIRVLRQKFHLPKCE